MNDPLRPRNKPQPRRAEPLQPDEPGRGQDAPDDPQAKGSQESLERAKEQARNALDNVRDV